MSGDEAASPQSACQGCSSLCRPLGTTPVRRSPEKGAGHSSSPCWNPVVLRGGAGGGGSSALSSGSFPGDTQSHRALSVVSSWSFSSIRWGDRDPQEGGRCRWPWLGRLRGGTGPGLVWGPPGCPWRHPSQKDFPLLLVLLLQF